ncbi:Signal transduction histidine-protein kinase/phosphatase DegS [Planctomycetes bacterium Poly30]|uniref:histidine kinase n=2 Tax=Saltatorellus ferox TaxID=2528018 RepID=A0A518ES07_9BACT|nr:Signal transduction histidine-protein kinase/phosphatase DegS [Planctomycetes bacterium Poly30]
MGLTQASDPVLAVRRADPADCVVTTYGLEHGLPTLSLEAVGEGPDGRLWLSTASGIFTFDGRWFRPLTSIEPASGVNGLDSIPPYTVTLLRDRRGAMWGGAATGRLWCIDEGQLHEITTDGAHARTRLLVEGSDGTVWAGGAGLVRIHGASVEVLLDAREFPGISVTSLLETPSPSGASGVQDFEVATNDGLFHWSQTSGLQRVDSIPSIALFRDGAGRRWRFSAEGISVSGVDGVVPFEGESSHLLSTVVIDQDRTLIAFDAGAYVLDFHGGEPRLEPYGEPYTISDLMPGPGDSVWVTTRNYGLRLLRVRYFHPIDAPAPGRSMFVVKPGGPDEVLLGSWTVPRLWRWRSGFPLEASGVEEVCDWSGLDTPSVPRAGAFDVLSGDGRSGFIQTRAGLLSFEGHSSEIVLGQDWGRPGRLVQVSSGAVWASHGEKLVELVSGQRTGRAFVLGPALLSALIADGNRIIGFENGCVFTFDTESMTRTIDLVLDEGLLGSLYLQPDGSLWALTDGKGLYRRTTAGIWHHWTTEQGLPTNSLGWASVVSGPTESTHLWINSNAGVFAVSLVSLEATAAGREEFLDCAILGSPESLAGDGVACSNGTFVVPTFEGPIVVDTRGPLPRQTPPALSLGDVLVDGLPLDPTNELRGTADVVFEYRAAQFPFQYASEVQYRLDGHDRSWLMGNDDRRVRYTSLAPGRYQLQLRSRAPGTRFGPVLMGPVLQIHPLWYNRTSVRLGIAAGLAALTVGAFRVRTRFLRKRAMVLEELLERVSLSEDRYRRLFQTTPTSIVMWSEEGLLLELNEAASRLFGFEQREWVKLSELAAGEPEKQTLRDAVRHALAGEESEGLQLATLVAGGEVHSCCWYLVPLAREGGEVWGLMTLVVDHEDEVQAAEAVRQLRRQLARAEEAERAKLARELHDDFSQRLAAVSLGLRIAGSEIDERVEPSQRRAFEECIENIEGLSRDVHSLSRQLHPAVLDDLGLFAALRSECVRRSQLSDAEIDFEADGNSHHLSSEASLALFRVAQEAMQNAVKHASASRILVKVSVVPDGLQLVVDDNGLGFEPLTAQRVGLGLSSMRERMHLVEGTLVVESKPGQGTTVRAHAPFSLAVGQ